MLSVEIGGVLSSKLSACKDALFAEVVDVVLFVLELLASELSLVILKPKSNMMKDSN